MIGHDEVGALAHHQAVGDVHTLVLQTVDFVQQHVGVHDHAVADYVHRLRPEDAAGHDVEAELALAVDDGVARVVAAGEPRHYVGVAGEDVDYLARHRHSFSGSRPRSEETRRERCARPVPHDPTKGIAK